ncbi:unnamed protein product [Camellia sinensis]
MVSRSTSIVLVAFLSAFDRDSFSVDSPPPALILLLRLDRPPLVLIFLLVLDRPPLALILLLQFDRPPLALILLLQFDRPPMVLIFLLRLGPPPPALIVSCPVSIVDLSEKIDEQEGFKLFGTTDSREPENAAEILEEREQKLLFYESTELGRASNLRKSLDWDSGFFTSAAVSEKIEEQEGFKLFGTTDSHEPENAAAILEEREQKLLFYESTELGRASNLHKSLDWDSGFLTSAAVSERIDEQEGFKLFGTTDSREPENAVEILEEREQKLLFYESTELGRASNLRKSLDWDSGFFTSAGVLDSEELFVINKGFEKAEAHLLPEVQEDLCRWRYAGLESTLDSDYFSLDSNQSTEVDLFEGIRASIEKSNIMSNICKSGVGEAHKRDTHSVPEKIDEQEGFKLFGTIDSREPENAAEILEEREQKLLFYESTQLGRASNLRKSLDWDSGFFTSAGLLDPEELFVINK